jgi:hypothetical protein
MITEWVLLFFLSYVAATGSWGSESQPCSLSD